MPAGNPSAYGRMALADAARAAQGIPESLPTTGASGGTGAALPDLLLALRNGKLSAETLMQFLAMLAGMGGQMPGAGGPQASPIEAAMMGGGGGAEY